MVELTPSVFQIGPQYTEIKWSEQVSDSLLIKRLSLEKSLLKDLGNEIDDLRVAYHSIVVKWKNQFPEDQFQKLIKTTSAQTATLSDTVWKIPVCYGGQFGKDLLNLASEKKISEEEIVQLHSQTNYRIFFYGFLPGFMYLSGLDPILSTPRKSIPDRSIPSGSVAIGGDQTGVYPLESPGGWHIIGRSPIPFFTPSSTPPVWGKPGDLIQFTPISESEYERLKRNPKHPEQL
jgi:KipI family sensor histidine kinase inhibitor